jgi:hypothetical protein
MAASSEHPDLVNVTAVLVVQVHGAGDARVEGVDGPDDLERLLGIGHRRADE